MNRMMKRVIGPLAALAMSGAAVQAATVVNGGFEQDAGLAQDTQQFGELAGNSGNNSWSVFNSLPGWTTLTGAGIEIQTDNTVGQIDAHGGEHYVELDSNNNSSMQQVINLAKGVYALTFWYSPRERNAGTNGIDFWIARAFGDLGRVLDDAVSGPSVTEGTQVGLWTQIVATFTVETAGNYNLVFAADGTSDSLGGFIDDVSVAPVPLPAGGLLMLGALGGLAALRRRARTA